MKIPVIKKIAETYSLVQLREAENALYEELPLPIVIEGEDEGEQLTHILAGIQIHEDMEKGADFKTALRNYTQRVRNSLS